MGIVALRRADGATLLSVVMAATLVFTGCAGRDDPSIAGFIGDPDAALEFLYPDGVVEPGTSPVAVAYIRDTPWDNNGFATLAAVLDEAATAHRDPTDPKAELSALAASDTINLLGQRGNIADTADDHLGRLLANYIIDIDGHVNTTTADTLAQLGPTFDDLPPSAQFNPGALDTVLTQTLNSPDALSQITNAALQLNTNRTAAAIQTGAEVDTVTTGVDQNRKLLDYLVATAGFPLGRAIGERLAPDARSDAMTEEYGNSLNLIPSSQARFLDYLNGQDIAQDRNPPLTNYLADNSYENASRIYWSARTSVALTTAIQLGEAGLLEEPDGAPWFTDGQFDATVAVNDENSGAFFDMLGFDDVWEPMFLQLS